MKFKETLKIYFFPTVASILHKLGFSWKKLGESILGKSVLIAQAREISKSLIIKKNDNPQNIVFLTMLGGHVHNLSSEIVIALGLKYKGHKITFVIDDNFYPINEFMRIDDEPNWNSIGEKGYIFASNLLNNFNFDTLRVSSLIDLNTKNNLEPYEEIIESSLLKHYKVGIVDDQLPSLKHKKELIEEAVQNSIQVGDEVLKMKPDKVIMSHGIYSTWGPQFKILNDNDIPIVTYGQGKRKGTKKFNWNFTGDWWDVSQEWELVKDNALTAEQNKTLDKYLESRITHKDDVLVYNFGGFEERAKTLKRFNLDENKTTVSLFTNVLWDAASANREIAFSNPIKWVIETIKWFESQKEKQLIVKIHPAEIVIGTRQPFIDVIKLQIEKIPDNVRIIEPHEKVNSLSIYKISDLGLVHTTTAGMEMQLVGVPVIVVSRTHFRDKGFTIDINSKNEYFKTIENFDKDTVCREKLIKLSRRYAYLLFERYQFPFEPFNENGMHDTRSFKFKNIENYIRKNIDYSILLDIIESRKEFVIPNKICNA